MDGSKGLLQACTSGACMVLLHEDAEGLQTSAALAEKRRRVLAAALSGERKRLVVRSQLAEQPLIFKFAFPRGLGKTVQGLVSSSARIEHRDHQRVEGLGLSLVPSYGFVEYRHRGVLRHAVQVQPDYLPAMRDQGWRFAGHWLTQDPQPAALDLARGLAAAHHCGFFHADLKPFHVLMSDSRGQTRAALRPLGGDAPAHPALRFVDFGRVAFRLTGRRQIINLYQTLRFIVPAAQHQNFLSAYGRALNYDKARTTRLAARTQRFLAAKLLSHPNPQL